MRRAATINIDQADLKARLAAYHERDGNLEQAKEFVEKALQLESSNATARLILGRILRREGKHREAQELLYKLTRELSQNHALAASAHFELAEVNYQQGQYRQALISWQKANKLQVALPEYKDVSEMTFRLRLAQLRACDYKEIPVYPDASGMSPPVFMVGFPRSGTTLLHHMLQDHPEISVMEEVSILPSLSQRINGFPKSLTSATEEEVTRWRRRYWQAVMRELPNAQQGLVIDKLPLSMIYLPLIKLLFPDAKIIMSLRHPCDCVFSNFIQQYALNPAMKNFSSLPDAALMYDKVFDLWNHYREQIDIDLHEVYYESLVDDVETEQRKLLTFLGLNWQGRVLSHVSSALSRFVKTPSYHDITKPLYRESVGRWRNYQDQLNWPPRELEPYIKQLGYAD